jgi:hypothetical protein
MIIKETKSPNLEYVEKRENLTNPQRNDKQKRKDEPQENPQAHSSQLCAKIKFDTGNLHTTQQADTYFLAHFLVNQEQSL